MPMNFEEFLAIITLLYLVQIGIFIIGLRRHPDRLFKESNPFISVVIAARNEEDNIFNCLTSVVNQTYHKSKFEIIVVDDASTDNTYNICTEFAAKYSNIKLIKVKEDNKLIGKANALAQGIDTAQGEVILITDADCTVPDTWLEQTAIRYNDNIGLVGGFTLQKANTAFEGMQSLDWAFIMGMAVSSAGFRYPLGSIGNNLSFKKSAYDEIGGYKNLKFSVTEDYTLVQAILKTKKWKYSYPLDPKHLVESKPCTDFKNLLRQKHRWGKGGLDMKPIGFVMMAIGFLMHLSPFIVLYWGCFLQAATAFMLKFIGDYCFLYSILKKLDRTKELKYFYWFELYFTIYVIILPFLVFFGGKVKWKGREL